MKRNKKKSCNWRAPDFRKCIDYFGMVLLGTSLISSAYAEPADACKSARSHERRIGAEYNDPRVTQATKDVLEVSGFAGKVVVCKLLLPYFSATVENFRGSFYVAVSEILVDRFTDAELRAVLGHELAHVVLGHRAPSFELTHYRSAEYEKAADALSAQWLGKADMRNVLEKLRVDAMRLPHPAQRRQAVAEISARLEALQ